MDVEIIKGNPELAGKKKEMPVVNKKRMAAYCRVSTDAAEQLESYQSQVKYYKHLIDSNPEWDLVDIYADEAVTGTMIDHRENFKRLINDCLDGRIDIVITNIKTRYLIQSYLWVQSSKSLVTRGFGDFSISGHRAS